MANYKCKMCGAPLNVSEGQTVVTCDFCQSKQTVANCNDERKENLFNRANSLRAACDFDKAILSYQSILSLFPNEPEAHWGVCLCKYGIEYVDDPSTKKKIPTIHRVSYDSILKDGDYLAALSYADIVAKEEYEEEAKQIADIQKNILSISQKEEPFDIFICYKETLANGKRSPDSVWAQEIYTELTNKGYKVFFARITLENKLGSLFEPYIFAALNSAKIMLVVGGRKEHFEAVWVKNEWSRFIDLMKTRPDRYLIPCYRDMDAYEMPEQFLSFQGQDMSKLGFMQDLIRGIDKIMGRNEEKKVPSETRIISSDVNIPALLRRAEMLISDGDNDKADDLLERVLDNDPENSQAYLLKLLIQVDVKDVHELSKVDEPLEEYSNYKKAYQFGDEKQKNRLSSILESIKAEKEEKRLVELYNQAVTNKNRKLYKVAIEQFSNLAGYRDSEQQILECKKLVQEEIDKENEKIYQNGLIYKKNASYELAVKQFEKIQGYKDAKTQIEECKEIPLKKNYETALLVMKAGKYEESVALLQKIVPYRDAAQLLAECKKIIADKPKENVYVFCSSKGKEAEKTKNILNLKIVCNKLSTIRGYKDVDKLLVYYEGILKNLEEEDAKKKKAQAIVRKKKMKKVKKITFFSTLTAAITITILLLIFQFFIPNGRQKEIQTSLENKEYDKAYSLIQDNGDYGDTAKLLQMYHAGQAFKNLNYEEGIQYVYNLGGTVNVSYDLDGGTSTKVEEKIKKKQFISNFSEKAGYTFYGWKMSDYSLHCQNSYSASITLKAQYNPILYTIKYDLSGGEFQDTRNVPSSYWTSEEVSIPNPVREGYTFTGWLDFSSGKQSSQAPVKDLVLHEGTIGNKSYIATWEANQYTIHLDAYPGNVSTNEISVTFDEEYSLPTPSYFGYDFDGWYDENNTKYTNESTVYKTPSDLYLKASYVAHHYDILYILDDGENASDNPDTYTIEDSDIILKDPYRVGYTFLGWTTKDILTPTKNLKIQKGSTGDLIITANWKANTYTVTINLNGGTSDKKNYSFVYDSPYSIEAPTRVGYTFTYLSYGTNHQLPLSGTWDIPDNVSAKANWKADGNTPYAVNYYVENLNGEGYTKIESVTMNGTSDETITLSPKAIDGFTPVDSEKEITIAPDGSTVVDFYYSRNSYTLSFVSNGGSSLESRILKYEEELPNSIIPTRDGYTFEGWYIDKSQTKPFTKMPAGDQIIYAYYLEETKASFFTFSEIGEEVKITKGFGLSGQVVVPKYIGGKLVTSIGDNAFENCIDITEITLSSSVDSLGKAAFKGCTSLVRINGTFNLSIIEESTFEGCSSLTYFPDLSNVTSIGDDAFKGCSSLNIVTFGDALTSIGNSAFENCLMLLQAPNLSNVTSIGNNAFKGCVLLTEIDSLNGCATFGEGVFTACENIAKLTIQFRENLEQFYVAKLFGGDESLAENEKYYTAAGLDNTSSYYVPKAFREVDYSGNGNIPDYFLYRLSSIETFNDSSIATNAIGSYAFSGCISLLGTFNLSSITSIGDYAFQDVDIFTELNISDEALHIGIGAFSGCSNITSVSLPFSGNDENDLGAFSSIFGTRNYIGSYSVIEKEETYYVPSGLTSVSIKKGLVGEEALANLSSLTSLTFGDDITAIGAEALKGCTHLESLVAPFIGSGNGSATVESEGIHYTISSTGNYPWQLNDGVYQSTNKGVHSSSSSMTITFQNTGAFTFRYKVSSESGYDKLTITLNGTNLFDPISGSTSFVERTINVVENDVFSITYSKDGSQSSGDDLGYFEILTPNNPIVVEKDNHQVLGYFFASKTKVSTTFSGTKSTDLVYESVGQEEGYVEQWDSYDGSSTATEGKNYLMGYYYAIPSTLTSVTVTKQTNIPQAAFQNISSLVNVNIPSDTTIINDALFRNCSLLVNLNGTGIHIPSNVVSIGNSAFENDTAITTIEMGNSVTSIGNSTFKELTSLTSLTLSSSLGEIGSSAFEECSSLENIDLPSSLLQIGDKSFYHCMNLVSITTNESLLLQTIGAQAFEGDTSLLSLPNLPELSSIGEAAFKNCVLLSYFSAFSNVTSIGKEAFSSCTSLTGNVDLASQVSIGDSAFRGCSSITSMDASNAIYMGQNSLSGCSGLKELHLPFVGTTIDSTNALGVIFGTTSYTNSYAATQLSTTYYIPSDLTTLSIGGTAINSGVAANLSKVTNLTIPDSVESIGLGAFKGFNSLESITLPFIGKSESAASDESVFGHVFGRELITRSTNCKTSEGGSTFQYRIISSSNYYCYYIPSTLREVTVTRQASIPANAFYNCDCIEKISIPTGADAIGSYAFYSCSGLKRLNSGEDGVFAIPTGVGAISGYAFYGCSLAERVTLGNVASIGQYSFYGCSLVSRFNSTEETSLVVPDSCASVGDYAFGGMALMTDAKVPDSVESIGLGAFKGFNSLESITLPFIGKSESAASDESVFGHVFGRELITRSTNCKTSEGGSTFQYRIISSSNYYCYYIPSTLREVTVTRQASIPANAFYNCDCIEKIHLIDCIDEIGSNAFYNCTATIDYSITPTRSGAWDGKLVATAYHGGVGTQIDPYQIFSPKEFIYFLNQIRNGETYENTYFVLTSNINLGGYSVGPAALTDTTSFKGTLNGNAHKVFNFISTSAENIYNGLFGYVDGTIKNIGFELKMTISSSSSSDIYVGSVVGKLNGTMENVYVTGTLTSSSSRTSYIGGLVGYNNGSILNSYSNITVSGTSTNLKCFVAGLVGYNDGTIKGSFAYGNISAKGYADAYSSASGLVAFEGTNSHVIDCYRYEGQIITKFGNASTSTNSVGTSASIDVIIAYCKENWDSNVWSFGLTLPSF